MYHQLHGTGMGVDFAGAYACLTIGYLEETRMFNLYLPQQFTSEQIVIIKQTFKRYMDDGFLLWPTALDIQIFISILGKLHPDIKYTIERVNILVLYKP